MALPVGSTVFLDYDVEGEPWHERVIISWVGDGDYVVFTPDSDLYVETVAAPPLAGLRPAVRPFTLPTGLDTGAGHPCYRFQPRPDDRVLANLYAEGALLAAETRRTGAYRATPDGAGGVAVVPCVRLRGKQNEAGVGAEQP